MQKVKGGESFSVTAVHKHLTQTVSSDTLQGQQCFTGVDLSGVGGEMWDPHSSDWKKTSRARCGRESNEKRKKDVYSKRRVPGKGQRKRGRSLVVICGHGASLRRVHCWQICNGFQDVLNISANLWRAWPDAISVPRVNGAKGTRRSWAVHWRNYTHFYLCVTFIKTKRS